MPYKNDKEQNWRLRIARPLQERLKRYIAKNPDKTIIGVLSSVVDKWLTKQGY